MQEGMGWMGNGQLLKLFGMENIRIDESEGDAASSWREEAESQEESEGYVAEMGAEDEDVEQSSQDILDNALEDAQRPVETPMAQPLSSSEYELHPQSPSPDSNFPAALSDLDETQSQYTYQQLSNQLQRALCKIKSKESVKSQTFLDRVHYFQKKKHSALEQRKQEQELETTRLTVKQTPTNAHSQRILTHYQPIQERSAKIVEEKRKRMERQQMEKRMREEEAVQQELQMVRPHKKSSTRSKEDFLSSMTSWTEQKQRKIEALASREIKDQMVGVTFHPQINSHSKVMVQRSGKVPIQQREVKPKKPQLDQECTFRPNLNKLKI